MDSTAASTWILECFVAVVVLYLLKRLFFTARFKNDSNLPPGPPSLPVIGSLHHLVGSSPHKSLARLAQQYGPMMSVRFGQKLCVVATSPQAAMELLKTHDDNFNRRPPLRATQLIWPEDFVFNDVTPSSQHAKKTFLVHLMSAKRLEQSRHVRDDEISSMLHAIAKDGDAAGKVTVVQHHLEVLMVNIISRLTFSKRLKGESSDDAEAKEFKEITESLSHIFGAFNLRDIIPAFRWLPDLQGLERRMKSVRIRMESFLSKIIDEHLDLRKKNTPQREKDMIDAFLDEQKGLPGISNDLLRGTVWNVFAAGTESTVALMEWILMEACRNPKILQKAQAELNDIVGPTRRVQECDIPKLKYIQAIVKEGLRLHPPVPLLLPHHSIKQCKVSGYDLPANTQILVNVWAIGRDARVWSNPLEFNPARFLDGSREAQIDFQGQHFELLPFGSGRRMCPGQGLGVIVVQSVIANLLHAFSWHVSEDIDMSEGVGLAVPMAVPFTAYAKARLPLSLYQ